VYIRERIDELVASFKVQQRECAGLQAHIAPASNPII
jgi:hypothetical protein